MQQPNRLQITVSQGNITESTTEAIIVNLVEVEQGQASITGGATGAVDQALSGLLSQELAQPNGFKGKLGETWVLHTHGKLPARYIIVVGLGKAADLENPVLQNLNLRRASAAAVRACQKLKLSTVASILHGATTDSMDPARAARLFAEGAHLGTYQFEYHKQKKDEEPAPTLSQVTLIETDASKLDAIKSGLKQGQSIAQHTNLARDWVFDAPNNVTPEFLVEQARAIPGLTCKIIAQAEMETLGMGALLQVAKGSVLPPFLIHLTYTPPKPPKRKIALVGKGITFDSGGLSLKPSASMELMKMDMAGAAAVLATMKGLAAIGELQDIQVDGIIPTCENMPSGHAGRPGDIIKTMSGKTVEINNTDAEGRLVLCDALTYVQQTVKPDEIIDLATLTGACIIALGKVASGIMGTSEALIEGIRKAGTQAGEKFWPLPLYDEYKDCLKSDVADLINSGAKGEAGSSAGGMFLKAFIDDDQAWVHLDIAGPAYTSKDIPEVPKGATGVGVRTLLYYLLGLQ